MYEWYEGRNAPKQWSSALENTAPQTMKPSDSVKEMLSTVSQIIKKPKEKT